MKIIKVNLKNYSYNIIVGNNIMRFLAKYLRNLDIGCNAFVITNTSIKNRYGKVLNKILKASNFTIKFKLIPDTEKSKSIKMASSIIDDLVKFDQKIRVFIIAYGGGVIGDLAGFVASIYKRGIPYIQIPTTLLAQVDSSIGGKTAIDLNQGKNLAGSFYQPRLVFSDIGFIKTLDLRQLRSGLAEVIKYGIIKDRELFTYLEKKYKDIFSFKNESLEFIITRSSLIKANVVEQDEKEEKGIRTILNFGHTIGHAIESAGNYKKYTHGEAISLGILVACSISQRLKLISTHTFLRIENLIRTVGLPVKIQNLSVNDIIKTHYRDKKFIGPINRFVLIKDIGKAEIVEQVPFEIIREAIKKRI